MYNSQFIIYTASDVGGPGFITGMTGSLISILNACLVTGYGSGPTAKPGAGWTKPLPDTGSVYGCFRQGTGSMFTLFVNDNAPVVANESWMTGYITMSSVSPTGSANSNFGIGSGVFPLPAQGLSGLTRVICRKSATADRSGRYWVVAADSSSFYMWISNGDLAGRYSHVSFGDFYSLQSGGDNGKCYLYGRNIENTAGQGGNYDFTDSIKTGQVVGNLNSLNVAAPSHFISRGASGIGGPITMCRKGDSTLSNLRLPSTNSDLIIMGILACPNPLNGQITISPLWVVDPSSMALRGIFRGLYQVCHDAASFYDGQVIQGNGTYAGKTFMIIKLGMNTGFWALEISNTIQTN